MVAYYRIAFIEEIEYFKCDKLMAVGLKWMRYNNTCPICNSY